MNNDIDIIEHIIIDINMFENVLINIFGKFLVDIFKKLPYISIIDDI